MAATKGFDELLERRRDPHHLGPVGDDPERPEDVVRILGTVLGNSTIEDDRRGFLDLELGALDEVREVGLEEWEITLFAGPKRIDAMRGALLEEITVKAPEELESLRIVGPVSRTSAADRGSKSSLPRSEQGADEGIELLELIDEPERRSQLPGVVPERIDVALSARAQLVFETLFELGAGETTRDSLACTRCRNVLEIGARTTRHVEAQERRVAGERSGSFPDADRDAGQRDVARGRSSQEDGAVSGRPRFERCPVGDDRVREYQRCDLPEMAPDEALESLRHVRGVDGGRQLADAPLLQVAAHTRRELRRREEDLGEG